MRRVAHGISVRPWSGGGGTAQRAGLSGDRQRRRFRPLRDRHRPRVAWRGALPRTAVAPVRRPKTSRTCSSRFQAQWPRSARDPLGSPKATRPTRTPIATCSTRRRSERHGHVRGRRACLPEGVTVETALILAAGPGHPTGTHRPPDAEGLPATRSTRPTDHRRVNRAAQVARRAADHTCDRPPARLLRRPGCHVRRARDGPQPAIRRIRAACTRWPAHASTSQTTAWCWNRTGV